jgi:hypothetical protein
MVERVTVIKDLIEAVLELFSAFGTRCVWLHRRGHDSPVCWFVAILVAVMPMVKKIKMDKTVSQSHLYVGSL